MHNKKDKQDNKVSNEKKVLLAITFMGWVYFIGLMVGRAVGIIATHDDVAGIGDFLSRLDIWGNLGFLGFLIAVTIGIVVQKK